MGWSFSICLPGDDIEFRRTSDERDEVSIGAESAIEFDKGSEEADDVVDRFRSFLDQVSPDDFGQQG